MAFSGGTVRYELLPLSGICRIYGFDPSAVSFIQDIISYITRDISVSGTIRPVLLHDAGRDREASSEKGFKK